MKSFTTHTGSVAIMHRDNIDTDQIIPKEHLKSIHRTGFGPSLFSDWRYLPDGTENTAFELNRHEYKNATILVVGNNFGCGSSREHAVWAIMQYGIRVVIAPTKESTSQIIPAFADIFRNNSLKNGLLLIEFPEKDFAEVKVRLEKNLGQPLRVDLPAEMLTQDKWSKKFTVDPTAKNTLLDGLDDIAVTLQFEGKITEYEKSHSA